MNHGQVAASAASECSRLALESQRAYVPRNLIVVAGRECGVSATDCGVLGLGVRGGVGWDAAEVQAFLDRVAEELDLLARDLAAERAASARLKIALRDWQTHNARASDRRWRNGR